jgi:ATP-binding cassette subfamily B protein
MKLKLPHITSPFRSYPCIRQHDITDCAAACLATAAKHYGLKTPLSRIREVAGTDRQGTNVAGVIKAAEKLGFAAKGVRGTRDGFFTPMPLPCIAHIVVDGSLLHYVIIHKISEKQVIIADPAKGIRKISPEEFFKEWTGVLIFLAPAQSFEKGGDAKSIYQRFFKLLIPQRGLLLNIFLASLVYTILGIGASFYFKVMMDDVLPNLLERSLHIISVGVIALYLFQILLGAFRSHMLLYMSQKLDINLILGYYSHVLELPMSFFGTRKVGEIISRFQDASKIRDAISGATLTIMIDTLMAVAGGIILFVTNGTLFVIAVVVVALYGIIVLCFNKPLRDINQKSMEENAQLSSYLIESLNGIETVKAFNSERTANLQTERKFVRLERTVFKNGLLNNVSGSLSGFVSAVGGVVILWVGAMFVIQGKITVGQLLTFNALLAYFLDPVKNLINLQPAMQTAIVASDRLGEILDLELEKSANEDKKISPASLRGAIRISNLDFRYGTRALVLDGINLDIQPGEKIALVGESGSGKTTLVKLLLSFYPWEKGEITIGGYNVRDINLEALREKIAYISQDIFLFSGTIYDNLTLGLENPDMEEVIRAAMTTRAHDFINETPLRYQTMLEENGANLSGGQKQRLAITRALLKKPDILIMDEATGNLDSITENAIGRTIDSTTDGVTSIIIAHRLSTIMRCDRIYVMDKGRFIESGTHSELMAKRGTYYSLWKEQLPEGE